MSQKKSKGCKCVKEQLFNKPTERIKTVDCNVAVDNVDKALEALIDTRGLFIRNCNIVFEDGDMVVYPKDPEKKDDKGIYVPETPKIIV